MGNGVGLRRRVHNYRFELRVAQLLGRHRAIDSGIELPLQFVFAQNTSKVPDLRGLAWEVWLVGLNSINGLPLHILGQVLDQPFIVKVEQLRQAQQDYHQAHRQPGSPSLADAPAELQLFRTQTSLTTLLLRRPRLLGQLRRH